MEQENKKQLYTDKIIYNIVDGKWDYNNEIVNKHCVFPDEHFKYVYRTVSSKLQWDYFLVLYSSKEKFTYDSYLRDDMPFTVYIVDGQYRGKKLIEKLENGETV